MLNQFHDVLPGTTISLVVDDVLAIYKKRISQAEGLIDSALSSLYPGSQAAQSASDANATPIDPLRLNRPTQAATNDKAYQEGNNYILENQDFKMTITKGRIVSLVDVHLGRELILAGPGAEDGGFMMYEDFPIMWDAWDVEVYHLESFRRLQFGTVKVDSKNAALQAEVKFGHSTVSATVRSLLQRVFSHVLILNSSRLAKRLATPRQAGLTSKSTLLPTGRKRTRSSNVSTWCGIA